MWEAEPIFFIFVRQHMHLRKSTDASTGIWPIYFMWWIYLRIDMYML